MVSLVCFDVKSFSSTLSVQSSQGTSVPAWGIANNLFDIPHKELLQSTKLCLFIYQESSVHVRTYARAYSWNLVFMNSLLSLNRDDKYFFRFILVSWC